jgi:EmrB/QacA subfamily drug resistance transporter
VTIPDAPPERLTLPASGLHSTDGADSVALRRRRWVLAATSLGAFMAFLDATIVNIAFPSIQSSFPEISRSWLSWVLNGYNIVFAALLLPAGRIADLVGHRRVFAAGVAIFGLASLLCAAAPSVGLLVAFRVVQAVGAALLVPTSLGLLLDEYPVADRVRAIAILGSAAALAAASGPVFGGLLVDGFDWRAVFVVNLPICAGTLYLTRRWVKERRDPEHGRMPDVFGIALFAGGMALLALALTRVDSWGWWDIRVEGCLALGCSLLAAFLVRSRRHPAPAVELALFRLRSVRMANCAIIVFAAAFYAKILIDVLFLTSIWHYSVLTAGAAMTPGPLITAILAAPSGRLADRYGTAPIAAAGAFVYALGCAWYTLNAGVAPDYVSQWLPGAALTGLGIALAFPSLTSAAVIALPAGRYATGSALNASARQLGGVLGIAIAVSIIGGANRAASHSDFVHAWTYAAVSAWIAAGVALALGMGAGRVPAEAGSS